MFHPLNENIHLQLHLYLLGLWQENPSQRMSHHLCRESPPWLLPKTQPPMMTDPPLQGEWAPALNRDPEPQKILPLRQQGDLEPSMVEHRGKKAGAVHVSMWGGGAEPHRRSPPDLGLGLEQRLASHHPSLTL